MGTGLARGVGDPVGAALGTFVGVDEAAGVPEGTGLPGTDVLDGGVGVARSVTGGRELPPPPPEQADVRIASDPMSGKRENRGRLR